MPSMRSKPSVTKSNCGCNHCRQDQPCNGLNITFQRKYSFKDLYLFKISGITIQNRWSFNIFTVEDSITSRNRDYTEMIFAIKIDWWTCSPLFKTNPYGAWRTVTLHLLRLNLYLDSAENLSREKKHSTFKRKAEMRLSKPSISPYLSKVIDSCTK